VTSQGREGGSGTEEISRYSRNDKERLRKDGKGKVARRLLRENSKKQPRKDGKGGSGTEIAS